MKKIFLLILITIILSFSVSACIPSIKLIFDNDCPNNSGYSLINPLITHTDLENIISNWENYNYTCGDEDLREATIPFESKDINTILEFVNLNKQVIKQSEEEFNQFKKKAKMINLNPFSCQKIKNIEHKEGWTGFRERKKWYCGIFDITLSKDMAQSTDC